MSRKLVLGLVGSAVLFVGVFAPIVSVPLMGSANYFQNGKGDGAIIMGLAVVSALLIAAGKYAFLWLAGLASLGVTAFTFVHFQQMLAQSRAEMQLELADNPFAGLGESMLDSVQLQWGWAILVIGALLVIASAWAYNTEHERAAQEAQTGELGVRS